MNSFCFIIAVLLAGNAAAWAKLAPEQLAQLPPPAKARVDFARDIQPIFESSCVQCHAHGKHKGGFSLETRAAFLQGGDSGVVASPGNSAASYVIETISGLDPDIVMPQKGRKLTREQVALFRAWIDQGLPWPPEITFFKREPANLRPRPIAEPPAKKGLENPVDRFVDGWFAKNKIKWPTLVDDRVFARRVCLDTIGLLPTPEQMNAFLADRHPDKRAWLVQQLLADKQAYATHWLTFWNDALRNDYKGTGYIDGGRKQISAWLYSALARNLPYDQFVAQLVNPTPDTEGFTRGILWRGAVNASMVPPMQAAQNISQVFLGVNLKCASCHNSFINDYTLEDSYGLASFYADGPLEIAECDKPTGHTATAKFLYGELGVIDGNADKPTRLKQLAQVLTGQSNGRLARTIVNRLWQRFLGFGLVEPADEMDHAAWHPELLNWLAEDLVAHGYDLKHTIERILTSRAYQLPAVDLGERQQDYVFHGPAVRRMTAEQFADALAGLTGLGNQFPATTEIDFTEAWPAEFARSFAASLHARWITDGPPPEAATNARSLFLRRTFALTAEPDEAALVVAANTSFTFYVNGKQAATGKEGGKFSLVDLRPLLKKGDNLFAASVRQAATTNATVKPAELLLFARIKAGSAFQQIETDVSWHVSPKGPKGWESTNATPANWRAALAAGDPGQSPWRTDRRFRAAVSTALEQGRVRAALVPADPLMTALNRPNREQVITSRATVATTLQGLELTNGRTLADFLQRGAARLASQTPDPHAMAKRLCAHGLGREPTRRELQAAEALLGKPVKREGVEDLLWAISLLPEFQLIW